jgi:hypothetical protein
MTPTLPVQVTCPKCGARYAAQVLSVVDVGQEPQLKSLLLRGALNAVLCPQCGTPGRVSAPLLYHDPQKELLLVYVPPELHLPMPEREKLTGSLVSALMSTVPAEQRKGYFLNPRPALTMQGLLDDILEADGITKEMLAEQRARSRLLQDMVSAMDDETRLTSLIEQNKPRLDYSFFVTLAAAAEGSAGSGQQQLAERLLKLRDLLLTRISITLPEPLPDDTSPDSLIERLASAKEKEARWAWVLYNRPLLDYSFFGVLTQRIEKAGADEAQRLRELRSELLEMTEQLDKEAMAAQEAKLKLLQEALSSQDPEQVLRQRKSEIDPLFLTILAATMRGAQQDRNVDDVAKLQAVNSAVVKLMQEDLPPELRLINELLTAEYPQGTLKLLQDKRSDWNADFVQILGSVAADLEAQKRPETAQRLREIRAQAEAIAKPAGGSILTP